VTDEQRDPAADLPEQVEEAFRPLAEFAQVAADAFSRAAQAWLEENRPLLEALGRLAQDPQFRAYAEARERGEVPPPAPPPLACYCLCGRLHPADRGVCDGEGVTTRRFTSKAAGPVDVALCAPCAAAQFLAELTR
jgi:hypothetical protein